MKKFRVGICLEIGAVTEIEAKTAKQAEKKVYKMIEDDDLNGFEHEVVHRDFWTQDTEEIKE